MMQDNGVVFKVRTPDGRIWDIPEHNLDAAMARGGKVIEDNEKTPTLDQQQPPSSPPSQIKRMQTPDGKIWNIPEKNVQAALARGAKVIQENSDPEYDALGKTLARSAKTIGSEIVGSIPDAAASVYNIPASIQNATNEATKNDTFEMDPLSGMPVGRVPGERPQLPLIPSAAHAVDSAIDSATGGYTKTKEGDSLQAGLRMASAVATPGGAAKLASKVGLKGTSKVLGTVGSTNPTSLAAAGVAGAVTSEAEKEGYGVPAAIGAGLAAGAGAGIATSLAKSLNGKIALAKLTGNSPKNIDLDAVKAYEASGLPFTNTTVNKSSGLGMVEQVLSKAPHLGTKQAKTLSANDKAYAKAVEDAIGKVGKKIVETEDPSSLDIGNIIKDVFEDTFNNVKESKNQFYDKQANLLPQGAQTVPKNLPEAIESIRKTIKTLRPSTDESFLLKCLDEIEQGLLFKGDGVKTVVPVPVEMIIGTKRSLNDIINWDVNASGVRNQLKKLQQAAQNDIELYGKTNPEWYKAYKESDRFFGENLGDKAFASDTVRKKILGQENPDKIIGSLNEISDFKALEKSLSGSESGLKFYDSIKREKLADLILGKTINPTTEGVNYSGFSKAMESPKTKELIRYLAGDNYEALKQFNQVAKAAVRRNARIPNPSGTAPTNTVISSILGSLGASSAALGGLPLAAQNLAVTATAAAAISWFTTNKRALKLGIEAAKKQAAGDTKAANIISGRLEREMVKDLGEDFVKQFVALS